MEHNRLLEIASEKEMCDLCVDSCDEKCFKCKKAKGIRSTEIREYHAAVGVALRRTAEDDKAREEGRLVELPCAVGQTVYEVNLPDEFAEVCEYTVQDISTKEIMLCDDWYPLSLLGKTVFLTRQEAEAALEEQK